MKVTWKEMESACRILYKKLPKNKYDGVVCISTGGLLPGKLLSELLDLPLATVSSQRYLRGKEKPISTEHWYANTNLQWNKKPMITNLLLVDDIIEQGKTMQKVLSAMWTYTSAKSIDIAVLYYKTKSVTADLSKCKIYKYKETDEWIKFPWELR